MSLAIVYSRGLLGMQAPEVRVEVHLANGLPAFTLVGLPETEVKESRDRVRAALQTAGFEFPARRITVNLAPADLPKESGRYDLPIAIGILAAAGYIPNQGLDRYEFAGELGLDGGLRPIRGALAMAYAAQGVGRVFVLPPSSAAEAALLQQQPVLAANHLLEVCAHLLQSQPLPAAQAQRPAVAMEAAPDLSDVRGQAVAKRALEVAAAGGHNLLFIGPPGCGKSMLAARLPGLLPAMTEQEALESAAMHSLSSRGFQAQHWGVRPFRHPHHSASAVALVGGGSTPKPGEISLAHHGVLFLDELPEFDRRVLDMLREPMETGMVHIARASAQASFPARFQLIAAMNPCPCGHHGNPRQVCRCSPDTIQRYQQKVSGPLLDRFDMLVHVPALSSEELLQANLGDNSAQARTRIEAAVATQMQRQRKRNAWLDAAETNLHQPRQAATQELLARVMTQFQLSGRGHHRLLRLARTLADLQGQAEIAAAHIAEAVQYRRGLAMFGQRAGSSAAPQH